MLLLTLAACGNLSLEPVNSGGSTGTGSGSSGGSSSSGGETARVVNVIDGDTIDVELNGERVRVRYVGVNTPERDEACYQEAVDANRALVAGQTVRLVRDTSDTDRFDRLLRYIYVGDTLVNAELVKQGVAEAVLYRPDERFYNDFVDYERQAARAGRGCHPTGIFNDGSSTR
jgi:endonuclease YncB( thermonuclease family)